MRERSNGCLYVGRILELMFAISFVDDSESETGGTPLSFISVIAYMIRKFYIGADPYKMLPKVDKTVYW